MIKYKIVIYWSEQDKAFLAEVPELPGCMADGASYEEVLANVQEVMRLWIVTAKDLGWPIPQPAEQKRMILPNADRAVVEMAKLRDYCLNLSHLRWHHKARV